MATAVERRNTASVESAIERQLGETCRRIRLFDTGASLLLLGSLVGGYALVFAGFDLTLQGADAGWPFIVRWIAYVGFLALAGVMAVQVLRRLTRHVNPYYAARRLEETVPAAKNSVISWLDLRDEPLPPALLKTLGGKAAHDLEEADIEQAIDRKPTWVRLGVFTAILLGVLILFAARPGQFLSLMRRAFLPFYHSRLVTRVEITLVRPEGGDAVVTEKQSLAVIAQIDGRVPDVNQPGAPALRYRYQAGDKFVVQPMQPDAVGQWTTRLHPDQVGSTGLWYQVTAGDAATPVYQVTVRAQPFVERYEITYKYRPYLNFRPETIVFPNQHAALPFIKRHRGTEVTLVVRTNRAVRQGGVAVATAKLKKELPTEVFKEDAQAFRCQWTLEQSGDFFVSFTSVEGENYLSRIPFPIDVLVDAVPTVTLTRPAQNVDRPANGTLEVEGMANDDLGLKELTLRLELLDAGKGTALKPLPYRPGMSLDLDGNGTFPLEVTYLDLIKLDELRTALDQPLKLKPGAVLRYWLEATDNSDYPNKTGNVGKSVPYEIKILPPADEDKQKQERENAVNKKQTHNAQQDQKLAKEKQERQDAKNQTGNPDQPKTDQLGNDLKNDLDKLNGKSPPSNDKGDAKGNEQQDRAQNKPGDGGGEGGAPAPGQKDQKPGDPDQAGKSKEGPQSGGAGKQPGGADQQPGETKDAGPPKETKAGNSGNGNDNQPGAGGPPSDPMTGTSKDAPKDGAEQGKGKDAGGDGDGSSEKPAQGKGGTPDTKAPMQEAKGKGEDTGEKAPSAQSKPGGGAPKTPPPGNQPPQGTAKAEEATGPRALSKEQGPDTGKKSLDPQLKNEAEKNPGAPVGTGKADVKAPPRDPAKDVPALAKGDEPPAPDAKPKEPTPQDVAQLKDLMQRKDGIGDWAAKTLTQMSKEAPDPKVRELAKEAVDQAGPKTAPSDDPQNSTGPKSANTQPPSGPKGEPSQANAKTGNPPSKMETKPAGTAGATGEANKNMPGALAGKQPQPGSGPSDDSAGDPAQGSVAPRRQLAARGLHQAGHS